MNSVGLKSLASVNSLVKDAAQKADTDNDGTLTENEIESAESVMPDGYQASTALRSIADYGRQGKVDASISLTDFDAAADKALAAMNAKDTDGDGNLTGAELTAAGRLKTFDVYATVIPKVDGPFLDGEQFYDLQQRCTQLDETKFESAKDVPPGLAKAIIAAANESTYASKTLPQVFAQVDQGEVIVRTLQDPTTKKVYLTVDYGAGDNTYGAVFDAATLEQLAGIHDGDLDVK